MARRTRLVLALAAAVGVAAPLLAGGSLVPALAEVRPICFPVLDTPVTYVGNFGDPRDGGARTHEGEDIMGRPMFRLLAATDGVILSGTEGIRWSGNGYSEHSLRMRGDDGYYYAYLHMNDDSSATSSDDAATYDQVFAPGIAPGVRVRAGQLVGYLGDSGNAGEGNDHLHFEIRTPAARVWDAVAIDPYDSLQAARRCTPVNSPTHAFTGLGGTITSDPDSASPGSGLLDVFGRGADNAVWTRAWIGPEGRFTDWSSLGGITRSGIAAVSPAPGRIDVFLRGADDALWTRTRTGSNWGEWRSLGGIIASDPDATSSGNGQISVAVRGVDDALWIRSTDGGTNWDDWTGGAGGMKSGPTIAANAVGRLDAFIRGLDNALWHRSLIDGTWGPWEALGGILSADPDAAVEDGAVWLIVRGTDNRLYCLPWSDQGTWMPVSVDPVGGGATVTSWGPDRLDVFVAGTDGSLYQTWWNGGSW